MADPPLQTCWTRKTPFQVGLVLSLCVTVPFCGIMIFLYAMSLTKLRETEDCVELCRVEELRKTPISAWTANPVITPRIGRLNESSSADNRSKRFDHLEHFDVDLTDSGIYRLTKNIKQDITDAPQLSQKCFTEPVRFPSVGALLEDLYNDDSEEQIIKCPVAVVAASWVLTLEDCVDNDKTHSLSVRVNSDFWSQGGTLKEVKNVFKLEGFAAINLVEDEDELCFSPVGGVFSGDVDEATVYFWNGDITLPLAMKSRYESIQSAQVEIQEFDNRILFRGAAKCEGQNGAPLFDRQDNLIGFQMGSCTKEAEVYYKPIDKYLYWPEIIKFLN